MAEGHAVAGPEPGTILIGKYRVEEILGGGGMGIVVRARHVALNEEFAIKILRDDHADEAAGARLLREARAVVRLKSEHVARVTDVGVLEDDVPYIVMELLHGIDLGRLLDTRGAIPAGEAVDYILQACEALAEAHALGIVHRDVKPANLFVARIDGKSMLKVLDFGISKSTTTDVELTQTQSVLGTPAYMSPEQMRSARSVDRRTDVWSVGSVLYELIEGEAPFTAENFSELVVKVSMDPPRPPRAMSRELAAIVMRCLAKSPGERFQTMADLAGALARFAGDPVAARTWLERMQRVRAYDSQPDLDGAAVSVTAATMASAPRRRPWWLAVALVVAAGAAAAAIVVATSRGASDDGAKTTVTAGSADEHAAPVGGTPGEPSKPSNRISDPPTGATGPSGDARARSGGTATDSTGATDKPAGIATGPAGGTAPDPTGATDKPAASPTGHPAGGTATAKPGKPIGGRATDAIGKPIGSRPKPAKPADTRPADAATGSGEKRSTTKPCSGDPYDDREGCT